jgi:hypothetical protein
LDATRPFQSSGAKPDKRRSKRGAYSIVNTPHNTINHMRQYYSLFEQPLVPTKLTTDRLFGLSDVPETMGTARWIAGLEYAQIIAQSRGGTDYRQKFSAMLPMNSDQATLTTRHHF